MPTGKYNCVNRCPSPLMLIFLPSVEKVNGDGASNCRKSHVLSTKFYGVGMISIGIGEFFCSVRECVFVV